MKRKIVIFITLFVTAWAYAGVTTYTFTSKNWASKVGADVCDGVTDGWICNTAAYEYMTGRTDGEGRLYSQGVSVKTSTNGAGVHPL